MCGVHAWPVGAWFNKDKQDVQDDNNAGVIPTPLSCPILSTR